MGRRVRFLSIGFRVRLQRSSRPHSMRNLCIPAGNAGRAPLQADGSMFQAMGWVFARRLAGQGDGHSDADPGD